MASKGGSSTSVSRSVKTETVNGRTVTKTVVTTTTVGPDGSKNVSTTEEISEGGGSVTGADFEKRFAELSFDSPQTTHNSTKGPTSTSQAPAPSASPADGMKPKGAVKTSTDMKGFIEDVVKAHNAYRKKHGKVGDLKNNPNLNELAQQWADKLAASGGLQHSGYKYKGDHLGENVAGKWGSSVDYTGQEATKQWYDEIKKFDFNRNEFRSGTGHFTQVVWKGSKEIGVGKAHGSGGVFVVCNYFPGGNVQGHFKENVFPA